MLFSAWSKKHAEVSMLTSARGRAEDCALAVNDADEAREYAFCEV